MSGATLLIVDEHGLDAVVGTSPAMVDVKSRITEIAGSPPPTVLIVGETGTEKDTTAKAIHYRNDRAGTFVTVACAAVQEPLLESELLGHESDTTIFLDEIAELSRPAQATLERLLEQHVKAGVIAGTNRDLEHAVNAGSFDEALFHRLRASTIVLPPLRERGEDVLLIADYYVERFNREFNKKVRGLDRDATVVVRQYGWPGNVRELRNAIERAMLLSEREWLTPLDFAWLARRVDSSAFTLPPEGVNLEDVERQLLVQALERARWNQTHAGRLLKINRDQVRYRIEKFGLRANHTAGPTPQAGPALEKANA